MSEENNSMEKKVVLVQTDSDTGGQVILDEKNIEKSEETFEERINNTINNIDIDASMKKAVTAEEFTENLMNDGSLLKELTNGTDLDQEVIKRILEVTNKVMKKEKVDTYKDLPEPIRDMIDKYVLAEFKTVPINQRGLIRRNVATALINSFISEITQNRAKYDFAHELASIYREGSKEIVNISMESHVERNKIYREVAEEIEDPEKKRRMIEILDRIDEAKNLTELKEFSKKCKIKPIELEKPKRVFEDFLNKYRDSANNIYSIDLAVKSIYRNINKDTDKEYTLNMVNAFFIAFCKQVKRYDESNPLDHAYMYYVLYYSVISDTENNNEFMNNIKEVIANLVLKNTRIK